MIEQDTTPQDKTNTSQDNQNTADNNTPDQTTTQHNAPHYITKSPQHITKNLPLQVLGGGTSAPTDEDEVISVVDWDGVMEESLTDEQYVKLVVDLKPITKEQADRLVEGVVVELSEEQLAFAREWVAEMLMSREAVEMVGEYMDRKAEAQQRLWGSSLMEAEERAIDDWWKDEKGEI